MRSTGRIRRATAPRRGSVVDNCRGGVRIPEQLQCSHNSGGLLLQNGLAHTEYGFARLFSGLVVRGATSGNHNLAQSLQ